MMTWFAIVMASMALAIGVGLLFKIHQLEGQIRILQLHKWIADDQRLAEIQKKGTTLQ